MDGLPCPWLLRPGKARPGSVWRPGTITGAAGSRSIPGEGPGPLGWWAWGALGVEKQLPMVAASGLAIEDVCVVTARGWSGHNKDRAWFCCYVSHSCLDMVSTLYLVCFLKVDEDYIIHNHQYYRHLVSKDKILLLKQISIQSQQNIYTATNFIHIFVTFTAV